MACGIMKHYHCHYLFSIQANYCFTSNTIVPPSRCSTKYSNGCNPTPFRTIPKASANKNPSNVGKKPNSRIPSDTNPNSLSILHRLREEFKPGGLGMDILSIALPAALALAADPITSLIDTGFVGHLGSAELAAVGVSGAVFNLVSKLFNVPLLNITTSFVAEEQASAVKQTAKDQKSKLFLPSVSNALVLALVLGILEAVALSTGSSFFMNTMGIPVDSPMRMPAEQFLTLRAFGAPPIVVALAAQGTFRGFKDTRTPLYAVGKYYNQ